MRSGKWLPGFAGNWKRPNQEAPASEKAATVSIPGTIRLFKSLSKKGDSPFEEE